LSSKQLKFLFIGAHPDDVEMGAAGTILRLKQSGHWIGIIDLTQGEMGSRGSAETRKAESKEASTFLALDSRDNLNLGDAKIENTENNRAKIAEQIRSHKPDFVFCNAPKDRHIDHGYAAQLVLDACFLSGLRKFHNENDIAPHRPHNVFHYIQDYYIEPSFVVNITSVYEEKIKAILCYKTQFFTGSEQPGPQTPISSPEFLEFFNGRASQMGRLISKRYGEGFIAHQPIDAEEMNWFDN